MKMRACKQPSDQLDTDDAFQNNNASADLNGDGYWDAVDQAIFEVFRDLTIAAA